MLQLRITIILFFCLILSSITISQNCLDYGEFDDPACFGLCGPSGWNNSGTAYIVEGDTYDSGTYNCSYNVPESPTGGTYQTLWDSNTGTIPGEINTTITGLTPGTEYAFGFWAATPDWICNGIQNGGDIDLILTIDGNTETVPTDIGWGLFQYCITASSSSIDIAFTVSHNGYVGPALIDDAFCSDLSIECCELELEAEANLTICPFEDLIIDLSYYNEVGNVDINWTSSPPSGMNFINDSDPSQLIFNYTSNIDLTQGTQIIFTANVSDDLCDLDIEVVVDVLPQPDIGFDFDGNIFCSNYGEFSLPTISNSGVIGEWDIPTLFLQDHPGELLTVFFTTTDPNIECPTVTEHFLEVQEEAFSTFDFPLTYCRAHEDIIYLETTTLEGHTGTWDPPLLEMELLPDGITTINFIPDDPFCTNDLELEIEIYSGDEIEFNLPEVICAGNDLYIFPTDNENNVPGSWEFPSMDLSNASGVITNSFTANTLECYEDYIYTFEVLNEIEITFDLPISICSSDPDYTLSNISNEGYSGQWNIPIIDPSTITGNNFSNTWIPDSGQSDCITETSIEIPFAEATIPTFNIPTNICSLDPLFTFPSISLNQNILGSWSTTSINPQDGPTIIQSTFSPDPGHCAESITIEIEVLAAEIPIFNIDTLICQLDQAITLPIVSENNISGSWSIPLIDPGAISGNELNVSFHPDPSNSCTETIDLVFQIESAADLEFDLPEVICWDENDFTFPDSSINGTTGTWSVPTISVTGNIGQVINSSFTPSNGTCANIFNVDIEVIAPFDVVAQSIDPSDCELMDGEIQLSGQLDNLEFSIDGGASWQGSVSYTLLGAGIYEILVRSTVYSGCILELTANLDVLQAPAVGSIMSTDVIGCTEDNGTITINVLTNDINEFSIDGGMTWQTNHVFSNLSAGIYEVGVRSFGVTDCVVNTSITIEDYPATEIINVTSNNISDCQLEDGSISIEAIGENLQYSIDGGNSWTDSSLFTNLGAGNYMIVAQSIDAPDCEASELAIITAPGSPIINSINPTNSSTCFPFSGSIFIDVESPDNLFSLDGISWQEENIFENLSADDYIVYVQSQSNPNCITEGEVSIIENEDTLPQADYQITDPSACNIADAEIVIMINAPDVEFSIDQGGNWQTDPNFNNLLAGNYMLIIRKIGTEGCTLELLINITNPDCPCNDLDLTLGSNNTDCASNQIPSVELLSATGMENPDFDIQWQNGETSAQIIDIENGWQVITIFYDEGCSWQDSIFIDLPVPIEFEYLLQDSDCPDSENGTIEIFNATGGDGNFSYSVNSSGFQEESLFENLGAGVYEIIVEDGEACSQSVSVEIVNNAELTIELGTIQNFNLGDTVILDPQLDAMSIDSFSWSPSTNILNPGELIVQVTPNADINYELEIFYGECSSRASIFLDLKQTIQIYIPNIINPLSSENSSLYPLGNESIELVTFSIYDRWGELIYSIDEPIINNSEQGWDGRLNGVLVNPGVFVYLLEYKDEDEVIQKVGTVTVIY